MSPNQLRRLFPNANESFIKRNLQADAVPQRKVAVAKSGHVQTLARDSEDEKGHPGFYFLLYCCYQIKVQDFDNPLSKFHTDGLRHTGLLPNDDPSICDGRIERIKVATRAEERTEIEVYWSPL